jgi:branched-chain amino acid transport system permease protein
MKLLCFGLFACAFNLLIGFHRPAVLRPRRFLRRRRLRGRLCARDAGAALRAGHPGRRGGRRRDRPGDGALAIRRQGIYFSMITLALAQMVYFAALRAPVHRRRGWPAGRAARQAAGHARPVQRPDAVLRGAGDLHRRLRADRAHRAFAVRPGAQGDQGKRAARHFAGLRRRPYKLLAFVLSAALAGLAGATKTAGAGLRDADRRALDHVRPGDPDDAGGRHGHAGRADLGAFIIIALENKLGDLGNFLAEPSPASSGSTPWANRWAW